MSIKIVIFLLFLVSCLNTAPRTTTSEDSSNSTGSEQSEDNPDDLTSPVLWYDQQTYKTHLSLDAENNNTLYLRGGEINNYLSFTDNYSKTFCLLVDFDAPGSTVIKRLKMKAVPQQVYNITTAEIERYIRVDAHSEVVNNNNCATAPVGPNGDEYYTKDLCPTCTSPFISEAGQIKLYVNESNTFEEVSSSNVNLSDISLSVDPFNSSDTVIINCNDNLCGNNGFDCCLSNQCVKHAAVRNGVDQSSAGFIQAENELISQPWLIRNYESFYYVCPQMVPEDPNASEGVSQLQVADYECIQELNSHSNIGSPNPIFQLDTDLGVGYNSCNVATPANINYYQKVVTRMYDFCGCESTNGTYEDMLQQCPTYQYAGNFENNSLSSLSCEVSLAGVNKDYECVEEMKLNSTADPFQLSINTGATYNTCEIADTNNILYYEDVLKRLYQTCGCSETTLNDMIQNCPAYTYNKDQSTGAITCSTPVVFVPTPFQDLDVVVNSKNVPHRFFSKLNIEIDMDKYSEYVVENPTDLVLLKYENYLNGNTSPDLSNTQTLEQEGPSFQYLDNGNLFPSNNNNSDTFNMNMIFGQMSVNVVSTRPATIVDIEDDQVYHIATISGNHTPCPTCGTDSWFNAFSAFPSTPTGVGLRSVGYSTQRDSWGTNITGGNYEDTIFGRACFVPPTMIPYTHNEKADTQTQRQDRLEAQAFFYTNGYRKDWYGFNYGALIGSFDGVTWFAVGKGRIVRSTTSKLYLAVNSPFGDLAGANDFTVHVKEYDGLSGGSQFDYNPDLTLNHPNQNEAGTCQRFHYCESDTDCVTQLGWEYACTNVSDYKTKRPKFNPDWAQEIENDSKESSLIGILSGASLPSGDSKRCVYRGAGALCNTGLTFNGPAQEDNDRARTFGCAPNFYCAGLNTADNVFNLNVSRFGAPLQNIPADTQHLFGQDANVLGRPRYYIKTDSSQTTNLASYSGLKSSIQSNFALMFPNDPVTNAGVCLPGKAIPLGAGVNNNHIDQQSSPNSDGATDYISQVGTCNPDLADHSKVYSCPVISPDSGNLLYSETLATTDLKTRKDLAYQQNSCGYEARNSNGDSPFANIEKGVLNNLPAIITPSLTRNSCLRKAGSVCHTNLDCGPNKLHAQEAQFFDLSYFGNIAEKSYFEEHLVCSAGIPAPVDVTQSTFNDYDMTENLCCREIGSNLSIYSKRDSYDVADFPSGLDPSKSGAIDGAAQDRYSRFEVLGEDPFAFSNYTVLSSELANILKGKQWVTLNETAKRTCCGGGWVRKFADETNDWTQNRFNFDLSNFACLNTFTPMRIREGNDVNPFVHALTNYENLLQSDRANLCTDLNTIQGGCDQTAFLPAGSTTKSTLFSTTNRVFPLIDDGLNYTYAGPLGSGQTDFSYTNTSNNFSLAGNRYNFYEPSSADPEKSNYFDFSAIEPTIIDDGTGFVILNIPTYIYTRNFTTKLDGFDIFVEDSDGNNKTCTYNLGLLTPLNGTCRYNIDSTAATISIKFNPDSGANEDEEDWSVKLAFKSLGGIPGQLRSAAQMNFELILDRLDDYELSGVPQAVFQPIYCADIADRLVPDLLDSSYNEVSDLASALGTEVINDTAGFHTEQLYNSADNTTLGLEDYVVTKDALQTEQIFSEDSYMCCQKLGSYTTDENLCCSGFGLEIQGTSNFECRMPAGTDLHVYFNKFISGEGVDLPEVDVNLQMDDSDFDDYTGQPKNTTTVDNKLAQLAIRYCENGSWRKGGVVDNFNNSPLRSFAQESTDSGTDTGVGVTYRTGYDAFNDGFRWNHHIYCDN